MLRSHTVGIVRVVALWALAAAGMQGNAVAGPLEELQPGHWYEVPNSRLSSVDPCPARNCSYSAVEGQAGVMDDWNGGAFATGYGAKGGLVVFGGGHNGYYGNEVYIFDVDALRWVRFTEPVNNPVCNYSEGELQDGSPCSAHTYDYVSYHPGTNSFIMLTSASNHDQAGGGSPRVHLLSLDPAVKQWRRGAINSGSCCGQGASSAYDPNRDVFWILYPYNMHFHKYDPDANGGAGQWTQYQQFNIEIDAVASIDPVRDLYVALEATYQHRVFVFDLKNPNTPAVSVNIGGDSSVPMNEGAAGFEWDPTSQSFITWAGGTSVYRLTPPSGDWRTGTWQWTRVPAAATNTVTPTSPNSRGTYGRWRYVPSVNAFVVVNRTNENVYFYKLNNAPPVVNPSVTFTADSTSLPAGGSTTLRWSAANADTCTASDAWAGNKSTTGTQAIGPLSAAATYTLTCSNSGGGSASRSVVVSVVAAPPPPPTPAPTVTLTANPTTVSAGSQSQLTWTSTNATACTASAGDASWPGAKTVNNNQTVGPINATTTYTLTCTGAGGSGSASVTVFVGGSAQPVVTLTASPTSIDSGGFTDLTWSSVNATSCAASGGWTGAVATSGTRRMANLTATQVYTLTCTGASGSASQQVTVTVGSTPPPVAIGTQPQESSSGVGAAGLWQVLLLAMLLLRRTLRMLCVRFAAGDGRKFMRAALGSTVLGLFALTASAAVDATSVSVVSTSGSAQSNVPITFGQVFKAGDVPAGSAVIASRAASGTPVPIQVDAKATHADGSLRHAVITLNVPSLGANAIDQIVLSSASSGGDSGSAVTLAQLLATTFDAQISLNVSGTTYSASARALLQSGTPQSWLSGPLVSEWIVGGPVRTSGNTPHAHLTAYFHVRAYSNGSGGVGAVRVDCIVENGWTRVSGPSSFNYAPTISVGGTSVYTRAAFDHYDHTRWHKQFWWPAAPAAYVKLDTAYLQATKAVPNYGSMTYTNSYLSGLLQSATPMDNGDLTQYMPNTGAQAAIGPLPRWDAVYLTANADVRALRNVLANHDSAGSYSIHYRDEATGRPVSIADYPTLTLQVPSMFPSVSGVANPNVADDAHQPSLGYLAYAITGDYYYLEEMQFWTSYNQIYLNADNNCRQGSKGIVCLQNRAQAWVLRSLGQTAYLTPDSHPYKAHVNASVGHNIAHFDSRYTNNTGANNLGIIASYDGYTKLSMWQDDFFTWTIAYLVDLGFNAAIPLRDWKFKFPVSRLGTTDYCFKNAATYQVQSGTSNSSFYPTIKAFYDANVALGYLGAVSSCNAGESITSGYPAEKDGYVANLIPAAAAAVEAGYPGASAGWALLKGSPVQPDFNDNSHGGADPSPVWNVVPRANPGSTAPSVTLTASPATVSSGGNATLTWSSTNSSSCTATGGWSGSKPLNGSEPVNNITQTTSYTLTCSGSGGPAAQRTVTVSVGSPPPPPTPTPTATLSASPTSVQSGGSTTLTWSSTNATSCAASGAWSGSKATSGSEQVNNLTAAATFTLVCSGAGGSTSPQSVQVTVTAPPPAPTPTPTPPPTAPGSSSDGGGGLFAADVLLGLAGLVFGLRRRRSLR